MSAAETLPFFAGEMQLAGWSESHNSGCKVTFWLSSPDDLEKFRAMTVRKNSQAGQRIYAALVEVGDDEQPVPPPPKAESKREPLGDLCWRAVQWCKDAEFQQFIRPIYDRHLGGNGDGWGDVLPKDFPDGRDGYTAHAIKVLCRVDSRKELDSDPAKAVFLREIVGPWQKHCLARGIHQ